MAIIGINGKIGSGKDLTANIIQYLTSECGNPNSSKHRSYQEFLNKGGGYTPRNFDHHYVSDWQIKKFAGKLKTIASLLTGIPVEKFEDQEFKKQQMSPEWNMTYRQFLQNLGTEAMRDGLHTNVWVNALFADYKEHPVNVLKHEGYHLEDVYPNWIITDMRFPNEMEAVEARGGITIRIEREQEFSIFNDKAIETHSHPSETSLDSATFDYVIDNNSDIQSLIEKVKEILIKEKII